MTASDEQGSIDPEWRSFLPEFAGLDRTAVTDGNEATSEWVAALRRGGDGLRRARPEFRGLNPEAVEMTIAAVMRAYESAMRAEGIDRDASLRVSERVFAYVRGESS